MFYKSASLLLITFFLLQNNASAAVYKCVDKSGVVSYKDKPCASNQKAQKVKIKKESKKKTDPDLVEKNKKAFRDARDKQINKYNQSKNQPRVNYLATDIKNIGSAAPLISENQREKIKLYKEMKSQSRKLKTANRTRMRRNAERKEMDKIIRDNENR